MNAIMYMRNEDAKVFRLPKASANIPDGISKILIEISLTAYKMPISKKDNPLLKKKRIRNGSKKRRFFKKPYKQNL